MFHLAIGQNWLILHRGMKLQKTSSIGLISQLFLGLTPPAGCAVWDQIWEREDLIAFASSYHDSMLGLCWCWSYVGSKLGHVGSMSGLRGALLGPRRLLFDQNRGSVGPCWGYVGAITRWAGLCWPILGLCWGYVGPAAVYVGARFAQLGAMLGLCWPSCSLCWGYVGPSGGYVGAMLTPRRWFWGYVVFMSSPSFPKFAWKSSPQWPARHPFHFCNTISLIKLNPAWDGHTPDERLKAPASGLRGSR